MTLAAPDTVHMIYVVDDDEAIRQSVAFLLKTNGYAVQTFSSGRAFLNAAPTLARGCVLLDIRMPDMDGMEVQRALTARGITLPIIVMTGHGDVDMAVTVMKAGAIDFIEKPFEKSVLLTAIQAAIVRSGQIEGINTQREQARAQLEVLTARERDVLQGLVQGFPNKTIAYDLGISVRTVEIHRANAMHKLGVRSLSEALRIAFRAGLE